MTQGAMEAPAVQGGLALATVSWLTHYGQGRIAPHPKKKKKKIGRSYRLVNRGGLMGCGGLWSWLRGWSHH